MKITIEKSAGKRKVKEVKVNEATVQDIIDASRIAGGMNEGMSFMAALVAQICTFDGEQLTYEDVRTLPASIFLELSAHLAESGVMLSDEVLSTLSGKDTLATKV